MNLKKIGALTLFALSISLVSGASVADEAAIKKAFKEHYPKAKIGSIVKTPYAGLYEVFLGNQIVYTDEKLSFVIVDGDLVDSKHKVNVTRARYEELTKIDFKSLPLEKAIKVVKGNGKRKLVVFSDVDCPFCKRLEQNELANIDNVTIYTFLYPVDQLHPDARAKSKLIWCASDRVAAWNSWVFENKLPEKVKKCEVPLAEVGKLAEKYGVASTPTLFFEDGKRMLGSQPYKRIEAYMKAASKYK